MLFLDYDCVLMPSPPHSGLTAFAWLHQLVEALDPHPNVRLVLHTSWRWHQTVEHMAGPLGVLAARVLGATARGQRYETILEWVHEHKPASYAILDDQHAEFPMPAPAELIVCNGRLGITDPVALAQLEAWLSSTLDGGVGV